MDIKRKAPHYLSDYTDAVSLQCLASFLFLYCACMSPVITFGGLLGEATEGRVVRSNIFIETHTETFCLKLAITDSWSHDHNIDISSPRHCTVMTNIFTRVEFWNTLETTKVRYFLESTYFAWVSGEDMTQNTRSFSAAPWNKGLTGLAHRLLETNFWVKRTHTLAWIADSAPHIYTYLHTFLFHLKLILRLKGWQCQSVGWLFHRFGLEWNISASTGWTALKICTGIHGTQTIDPNMTWWSPDLI